MKFEKDYKKLEHILETRYLYNFDRIDPFLDNLPNSYPKNASNFRPLVNTACTNRTQILKESVVIRKLFSSRPSSRGGSPRNEEVEREIFKGKNFVYRSPGVSTPKVTQKEAPSRGPQIKTVTP